MHLSRKKVAFSGYKTLNRIQSRIFRTAYTSNENMLVCAPTGMSLWLVLSLVRADRNVSFDVVWTLHEFWDNLQCSDADGTDLGTYSSRV
jgi:hypothetical protein